MMGTMRDRWVKMRLDDIQSLKISLFDALIPISPDIYPEFQKHGVWVSLGNDGLYEAYRFEKNTPLMVQQLLRSLMVETQVGIKRNALTWELDEERYVGKGVMHTQFSGNV